MNVQMIKYVLHENCIYNGSDWQRHEHFYLDLDECQDYFKEDRVFVDMVSKKEEYEKQC